MISGDEASVAAGPLNATTPPLMTWAVAATARTLSVNCLLLVPGAALARTMNCR